MCQGAYAGPALPKEEAHQWGVGGVRVTEAGQCSKGMPDAGKQGGPSSSAHLENRLPCKAVDHHLGHTCKVRAPR